MQISCTERMRNLIIKLDGDIDHHSAEEIRTKIDREFLRSGAKNIIFDFRNVSFMDSSGIGMIMGRYRSLENQGGTVSVVNLRDEVSKIFELSGLPKIVASYPSLEEAEAALDTDNAPRK